jgi:hypothetical protein
MQFLIMQFSVASGSFHALFLFRDPCTSVGEQGNCIRQYSAVDITFVYCNFEV